MELKMHSQKFLRQRKFLMVMPLIALPFVTAIFAALGGGKGSSREASSLQTTAGLNTKLPDAHFKKGKEKDKLGLYEEAGKDSARIRSAMINDPYFKAESIRGPEENKTGPLQRIYQKPGSGWSPDDIRLMHLNPFVSSSTGDSNEAKVMKKLAQLETVLQNKREGPPSDYFSNYSHIENPDLDKLTKLSLQSKQSGLGTTDPELEKINSMLEKVMNIQHPERLEDSMRRRIAENKPHIFSVQLSNGNDTSKNGFFGLSEEITMEQINLSGMEAVVDEDQTLVSGAVVQLRLLQDIYVHSMRIPKDQLVYGICTLINERLKININTLRSGDNILPVSLEVYDLDGLAGIYVPGSISRDVSKQSADEAISTIGLTTLDPSLGAQAANAGLQAAKTLMSKKIKQVRVSVKAGYRVLIWDNNQK
jgi:conjugative transposon TraM protein